MTIREAQIQAIKMLENADETAERGAFIPSPSPVLDCAVILSHLLGMTRTQLLAHPETELGTAETAFFEAIRKRKSGLPVAYITGFREFWGLSFHVTPAVLIPKPDTEILVERALQIIDNIAKGKETSGNADSAKKFLAQPTSVSVLDVCTGSGCIAIALKHDAPGINMTATDISPEALEIAELNAKRLTNGGIRFLRGDLREGLPGAPFSDAGTEDGYDLIVSNPPYVPSRAARNLLDDGRCEPILALDGGEDGLDLFRSLAVNVRSALRHGGIFLAETGEYNAKDAASFLKDNGFSDIIVHRDLEGQDRVVEGILR